jgi:hypothetical protein
MRWFACVCILAALGSCEEEAFIPGTGTLPDCNDAPIDLNDTVWFNEGTVTILTDGCPGVEPETMLESCPENWALTQNGNDLDIIVDVYRVNGRLCGDKLYLEGGWWLSVKDEQGACWYEDDDGDEFGIQEGGNLLTYIPADPDTGTRAQLKGILRLEGSCRASYDATFSEVRYPPPN